MLFWLSYVLLWALTAVQLFAVFLLYRYVGQQMLGSREKRMAQGPGVDSEIAPLRLRRRDGSEIVVSSPAPKPILLYIANTTCTVCERALPALGRFAQRHAGDVETVLVVRGNREEEVDTFVRDSPPELSVVSDPKWSVGARFGVSSTPFCFVVDTTLKVRGRGSATDDSSFEWFYERLLPEVPVVSDPSHALS